jgi:hypothetical protein
MLHEDVRPDLLSMLSYNLIDQWYIWLDQVEAGLRASPPIALDYYRSYNADNFNPRGGFDPWEKLLGLLPPAIVVRCSEMGPDSANPRNTHRYTALTNDTGVGCHDDAVWFSPACRADPAACVPLLIPYNFDVAMQLAFFLRMPVAVVMALGDGYYDAVRGGRFLFGWYQPSDDPLTDASGRYPTLVNLPHADAQEQQEGIYRTGFAQVLPPPPPAPPPPAAPRCC